MLAVRLFVALLLLCPTLSQAQDLTVTPLGTSGPNPAVERFGPGALVRAGAERLLFDAGRGVTQRLWQINVKLGISTRPSR